MTYNRLDALIGCVEAIEAHTSTPFHLVIADDGSQDGSAAWARESGIPVVTGRNFGCAWNKNRALWYLLNQTHCDPIILLEDDCWPDEYAWESDWLMASLIHKHVNYANDEVLSTLHLKSGNGTPTSPYSSDFVTGQCTISSRQALEQVGFLDSRFRGWGVEHAEWSMRFLKALGEPAAPPRWKALNSGLRLVKAGSFVNREQASKNQALWESIREEPVQRRPWRDAADADRFRHEQRRAVWSVTLEPGEPGVISVICPTRSPELAARLYASLMEQRHPFQMIWVWNGEGPCPLPPGKVAEYRESRFSYEEAINRGVIFSTGEILLIVNDDVVIETPDLLRRLAKLYADYPKLGAAYGGKPGDWEVQDAPESPEWHGACWSVRRSAFCRMGGLEESVTAYGGDEFVTRVRVNRLGYAGARCQGWTYRHDKHSTYGEEAASDKRHVHQAAHALGWRGCPENPDLANAVYTLRTILDAEQWRIRHLEKP